MRESLTENGKGKVLCHFFALVGGLADVFALVLLLDRFKNEIQ